MGNGSLSAPLLPATTSLNASIVFIRRSKNKKYEGQLNLIWKWVAL